MFIIFLELFVEYFTIRSLIRARVCIATEVNSVGLSVLGRLEVEVALLLIG